MKRFMVFVVLVLALFAPVSTYAQQTDDRIVVHKSDLPAAVVTEIETKNKIQQVGQYAGVGKEVGEAINEGLKAITDQSNKFADTKVGVFTMWIIAYKVIGRDVIHYVVGAAFFAIMLPIWGWSYVNHCKRKRVLSHETKDGDKTYEVYDPDPSGTAFGLHLVWLAVIVVATMITIFA